MKAHALLLVALLSSCALMPGADNRRRQEWVQNNPQADPRIISAISQGQIVKGMRSTEVQASWGPPCGYCRGTRRTSEGEWWEYNPFGSGRYSYGNGTYLFFNNSGVLEYWTE